MNKFSSLLLGESVLSYFLDKRPSPLVLLSAEVFPLRLYLSVQFQLGVTFSIFEAQLLVDGDEVREYQCGDSLVLIFGFHGYEQQIEHLGTAFEKQSLEQVVPAERKQTSVRFLQGFGE